MKKAAAATSALLVGAFASPARADDGADGSYDWTGFYLGAGAGFNGVDADWKIDGGEGFTADEDGPAHSSEGLGNFGIQAGYNHQLGPVVVGGQADYTFTDVDDTARFDGGEGADLRTRLRHLGTFRARVGFAMDRVLIFAAGGLALSDARNTYDSDGSPSTESDRPLVGWVAGGGVELGLAENTSLIAEGMFASFDGEGTARGPFFNDEFDVDTDVTLVRIGLNFRF